MNPEDKAKLNELYEWMQSKKTQQISTPLDDASRNIIGSATIIDEGTGSTTLTQSYPVVTGAITGPKAYLDTIVLNIEGVNYEIPYIASP